MFRTAFYRPLPAMRFLRQGEAPFWWITRGRVCFTPTAYTPTTATGTAELPSQLCAHLRGIDLKLAELEGGGPGPLDDAWETADGLDGWETADGLEFWETADA